MPDRLYLILHNLGAAEHQMYQAESPSLQSTFFSPGDLEGNFPLGDFRTLCCIFDELIASPSVVLTPSTWERRLGPCIGGLHGCRVGRTGCRHLFCTPSLGKQAATVSCGTHGVWKEKEAGLSHRAGGMDHWNPWLSVCCIKNVPPKSCDASLALYCVSNASGFSSTYRFIRHAIYLHLLTFVLPPTGYNLNISVQTYSVSIWLNNLHEVMEKKK